MDAHRHLLTSLTGELFQAERSASRHPRVEARRLGDVPPARAMLAVAEHAEAALAALEGVANECGLPTGGTGRTVGTAFSVVRENLADLFVDVERNYRGTLLGMRHGLDLVELYREVIDRDPALVPMRRFCDGWLERRRPLVEACAASLSWFADHPDVAVRTVSPLTGRVRGWLEPRERLREVTP